MDSHARQRLAVFAGTPRDISGPPEPVSALSFSPDAHTPAVVGTRGTTQLWDVTSNAQHGHVAPGAGDTILAPALSPDNQTLYSAGDHVTLQKADEILDKVAAYRHRISGSDHELIHRRSEGSLHDVDV
ncbi:WD40 repeat domain-containing protein [Streptomyces sp. NRRL S-337]|uniref:WD40 repeat domain-containing protein n=1 Tax=Streptomyces sp. NRRL S-337 TaxID=1463900 RepID=UPI00131BCEA8|nr:WD40 repeat domain-containing protein [Streptomyces sp. NRRL S-337]